MKNDHDSSKKSLKRIKNKVRLVRFSRINKSTRLQREHSYSIVTTSMLSLYVVIGTLIPEKLLKIDHEIWNTVVISAAIFIIIIHLLEVVKNFSSKNERLIRSYLELGTLEDDIDIDLALNSNSTKTSLSKFYKRYHSILKEIHVNHDDKDFCLCLWRNKQYFIEYHPYSFFWKDNDNESESCWCNFWRNLGSKLFCKGKVKTTPPAKNKERDGENKAFKDTGCSNFWFNFFGNVYLFKYYFTSLVFYILLICLPPLLVWLL